MFTGQIISGNDFHLLIQRLSVWMKQAVTETYIIEPSENWTLIIETEHVSKLSDGVLVHHNQLALEFPSVTVKEVHIE